MQETDDIGTVMSVWLSGSSDVNRTPVGWYEPNNAVHVGNAGMREFNRMVVAYRALQDAENGSPAAKAAARFLLNGCRREDAAVLLDALSEEFHTV